LLAWRGEQQSRYNEELAVRVEQQSRYIEEIKALLVPTMVANTILPKSPQEQGLGKPSALRSTRQLQNPTGLFGGYGPVFGTGPFNLGVDTLETLTAKVNGLLTKFGNIKAGPQGEQGLPGLPGVQGNTGSQGLQGLQGSQGVQGVAGNVAADQRLAVVEKKVLCVSADSTAGDLFFVGCNVHLENGDSGDTLSANGKGNLVIGFNEEPVSGAPAKRTGSHNIVIGKGNAYSASGGIVSGLDNRIDGNLAVLLGGRDNAASGLESVIAGGRANTATGDTSVVAGGLFNSGSGNTSVVAGGFSNYATGTYSVVAGGRANSAKGTQSVVAGGTNNNASGRESVVTGGSSNVASGIQSVVAGGFSLVTSSDQSFVSGTP
jgi:hypothetical protein